MQLTAVTRKSAMMALTLFVVMLVATMVRRIIAPYGVEMAGAEDTNGVLAAIVASVLFLGGGVVEGKIFPRTGLNNGYSTLPIPLYALLAFGVVLSSNIAVAASVSLLLALAIYLLINSLLTANNRDSVFFASMLLGIMALIYPPSVVLFVLLPLSVVVLALSMRHLLLMVVGYTLPFLASSYVSWYAGNEFLSFGEGLIENFLTPRMVPFVEIPYVAITMIVAVVGVLLWGAVYVIIHPDKMSRLTRVRRSLHLLIWSTVIILTMLFVPSCDLTLISILAVPLALLLSFMLGALPNNYSTIAYWVLLAIYAVHLFVA